MDPSDHLPPAHASAPVSLRCSWPLAATCPPCLAFPRPASICLAGPFRSFPCPLLHTVLNVLHVNESKLGWESKIAASGWHWGDPGAHAYSNDAKIIPDRWFQVWQGGQQQSCGTLRQRSHKRTPRIPARVTRPAAAAAAPYPCRPMAVEKRVSSGHSRYHSRPARPPCQEGPPPRYPAGAAAASRHNLRNRT